MDPCLLLDLGNSRGKWLYLVDGAVEGEAAAPIAELSRDLAFLPAGARVLIASVVDAEREALLTAQLQQVGCRTWFARSPAELDGLVNGYDEPAALGVDRWLAMLGAWQRHRGTDLCVIDAGSALTIDFIHGDGRHAGGYIVPGADLMRRSLLSGTGRVRFDETAPAVGSGPGRCTTDAVRNGVRLAQVGAVRCALETAGSNVPACRVLLCGGGADTLAAGLGRDCVVARRLVFEGLLRQAQLEGLAVPDAGHCVIANGR